jgi:hypothetical protein
MSRWPLSIGTRIKRAELHARFGGRRQGSISSSAYTPNVFIFSHPSSEKPHGYIDSWRQDGCFHYTGEGQRGDQRMIGGNAAILNARQAGNALRVFKVTGNVVEYEGEFELDPVRPFYRDNAPETGGGPMRSVVVFRLRRIDAEPCEVEKRVCDLMQRFVDQMQSPRHMAKSFDILPVRDDRQIFTGLYGENLDILIEVKGCGIGRDSLRTAIGDLLDYRHSARETATNDEQGRPTGIKDQQAGSLLILCNDPSTASDTVSRFPTSAIAQLEEMIHSPWYRERDFQQFLEKYPEFITGLNYHRAHPQLMLINQGGEAWIPDFMLEQVSSEFCDVLELKLPYDEMVLRLPSARRTQFRRNVCTAVAQTMEYQQYFEDAANRAEFYKRYGLQAYHPTMILLCGRTRHFRSDLERQELRRLLPTDLHLWTYDDLLGRARQFHEFYRSARQ